MINTCSNFYRIFCTSKGQTVKVVTNVMQAVKVTFAVMRYIRLGGM